MTLYLKNPQDQPENLPWLMSSYGKIPGYEVNTRTSIAFPHTSNEQVGLEVQSTLPFISAPKNEKPQYKSTEHARGLSERNG